MPEQFKCPITLECMTDPVIATDGHTYERSAIQVVLRRNRVSPMTRETLGPMLLPNRALRQRIDEHEEDLNKLASIARREADAAMEAIKADNAHLRAQLELLQGAANGCKKRARPEPDHTRITRQRRAAH